MIQVKLKEALRGKKFLFVHDDVWNENYICWDDLKLHFQSGASGSKIIVTTRHERVASMMGNLPTCHLKEISDEDCWCLCQRHAFPNAAVTSAPSDLEEIGRQIAQKCKGHPLAAKSIGGLLRSKLNTEEWKEILNDDMWKSPDENNTILPALGLSYCYLPPLLKRCFAYCSIYPKGFQLKKSELISLWMAEDLLQPEGNKTMEQVGVKYFDGLISMGNSVFTMHDLINDLAKFLSGEFCFKLEDGHPDKIGSKTCHLAFLKVGHDSEEFEASYKAKFLRTFLPLSQTSNGIIYDLTHELRCDRLMKLQYLKVLSLSGYCIGELPNSIGNLKHLSYLDLSSTGIQKLSDTLCGLYNLQTLLLSWNGGLTQLPTDFGRLINLHTLLLSWNRGVTQLPTDFGRLINLHTLLPSLQSMSIHNCPELESFPEGGLPSKLQKLCIYSCRKVLANCRQWGLRTVTCLEHLAVSFEGCEGVHSFPEEGMLPTTLTSLLIINNSKLKTMNFRDLNSLKDLTIQGSPELQCFPNEGLPTSLSCLTIWDCPLLEQRCQREQGEDWFKIAHIPHISINNNQI